MDPGQHPDGDGGHGAGRGDDLRPHRRRRGDGEGLRRHHRHVDQERADDRRRPGTLGSRARAAAGRVRRGHGQPARSPSRRTNALRVTLHQTVAGAAESLLAFENAALPLAVCDPGGRIVMCNRALRALLGYELDEVLGMPVEDIVEHDPDALYTSWDARLDASAV
ncbi:MAG: PAS domain-containing protein, partial [Actinobacteria bacterium]